MEKIKNWLSIKTVCKTFRFYWQSIFSRSTVGYFLKWLGNYLTKDSSLATTQEVLDRVRTCPECFEKNKCIHCGCNFTHMITVRKPCNRYKF